MRLPPLAPGILIKRYKRFLADVAPAYRATVTPEEFRLTERLHIVV